MKSICCRLTMLFLSMLLGGCVSAASGTKELRRLPDSARLPVSARIGVVELKKCGAAYLDKLNHEYHLKDGKARQYQGCTEAGYPAAFNLRFRKRMEKRLGRQIVAFRSDKPFRPNLVSRDAEKLALDYVIAGDLLYQGENSEKAAVSAFLYLVSVKEKKVVMYGRVIKSGAPGEFNGMIDEIADEFYEKATADM